MGCARPRHPSTTDTDRALPRLRVATIVRRGVLTAGYLGFFAGCRKADLPVPRETGISTEPRAAALTSIERPRIKVEMGAAAMGTKLTFIALTSEKVDETGTRAAIGSAIAEVARLEALMTTWKDDSEVSRINQAAGRAPVRVGPDTMAVIDKSLWISAASEGVFDITFEVMHGLWKFDQDLDPHPPSAELLAERRKLIDNRHVVR